MESVYYFGGTRKFGTTRDPEFKGYLDSFTPGDAIKLINPGPSCSKGG